MARSTLKLLRDAIEAAGLGGAVPRCKQDEGILKVGAATSESTPVDGPIWSLPASAPLPLLAEMTEFTPTSARGQGQLPTRA
jgi:hypothetical protein